MRNKTKKYNLMLNLQVWKQTNNVLFFIYVKHNTFFTKQIFKVFVFNFKKKVLLF